MIAAKKQIPVAINFLFPELQLDPKIYQKIAKFIRQEYEKLGTSVLWYRNKEFIELLDDNNLCIGKREVIITEAAVLATQDFQNFPHAIFKTS